MATEGVAQLATGQHNLRRLFFFSAELVFAIIGGLAEAYMYTVYMPSGPFSQAEAIARATITQIAIVLFGVAAIEGYQAAGGGSKGLLATLLPNVMTLLFSGVAIWFMHESALVFFHPDMLVPIASQVSYLPNGVAINPRQIDPWLIASVPLFQVALNWFGPLIVQDRRPETAEERAAREAREVAVVRHQAEIKALIAAGRRQQMAALLGRVNPLEMAGQEDMFSAGNPEGSDGQDAGNLPAQDARDSTDQNSTFSAGKTDRSRRMNSGTKGIQVVPTGMWTAADLRTYVQTKYHVEMGDAESVKVMSTLPGRRRLEGVRGNPYAAPKASVRTWADRAYAGAQRNEAEHLAGA